MQFAHESYYQNQEIQKLMNLKPLDNYDFFGNNLVKNWYFQISFKHV